MAVSNADRSLTVLSLVLTLRFFIAFRPLGDLFLCAKDLFIAAMVDGSALRADVLIADEANRLDATKAHTAPPSGANAPRSEWFQAR
jgi:hypothetical protein